MIQHTFGLLTRPSAQWRTVAAASRGLVQRTLVLYPCIFAILPAVAWFYGTTRESGLVGGRPRRPHPADGGERPDHLHSVLRRHGGLGGRHRLLHPLDVGHLRRRVQPDQGHRHRGPHRHPDVPGRGAVGFYPLLWLDLLVGVAAISWSVYLMYLGIPIVMDIPEERGFLFSSAVLGVALVILICLMVGSVILWEYGAAPQFTD